MPYFPYQGKQIFYSESGTGRPLVMLHGNTASSVLFEFLLPLYQRDFRVIRMDFLGNGRSNRVETFPEDLWIEQAGQVLALIEHLKIEKADLLGTSGGAWAAVNAALKRPDLVHRVVADSFDGSGKERPPKTTPAQGSSMNGARAQTGRPWWTATRRRLSNVRGIIGPCSASRWKRCASPCFLWGACRTRCAAGIWRRNTRRWPALCRTARCICSGRAATRPF